MTGSSHRIPLASPSIGARERELVEQVLASGVLALGPFAATFETQVAEMAGRRFGVACSSGTAGLHMVVRALGIGDGDEVITTPFSFVASANCLLYERAIPRFVDIEEDRLGLDPDLVERRRRAVDQRASCRSTSSAGRAGSRAIAAIADGRGWPLIEDACEALGSSTGRATARGRTASRRRSPSIRTSRSRPAKAAWSSPTTPRLGVDPAQPAQPGPRRGRDVASTRPARLQLPARRAVGGDRRRPAGAAAPSCAAGRARVVAAYARALGGS